MVGWLGLLRLIGKLSLGIGGVFGWIRSPSFLFFLYFFFSFQLRLACGWGRASLERLALWSFAYFSTFGGILRENNSLGGLLAQGLILLRKECEVLLKTAPQTPQDETGGL